jgi:hypothetical protein
LNVQLLTGRDRVGSQYLIIGDSVACVVALCGSCRRLRFFDLRCFDFGHEDQKIAACGSSYIGIARAVPGKLLDNGYGIKKASPWLAFVICGPFQGRTE